MASPQIENGHVKIANELWDALTAYRLPGEQRQCLDVIIRKTYGFNKKSDAISLSQFVEMTGIVKPHVVRAINALLLKNVITVTKKGNAPANVYEIVKDFDRWEALPKKVTLPKKVISVTKKGNLSLPKKVHTKDNTTKDTITKDIYTPDFELFWKAFPNKKCGKTMAFKSWKKCNGNRPDVSQILLAIGHQKKSIDWQKESGQYIPMATTWLNQSRWEAVMEIENQLPDGEADW